MICRAAKRITITICLCLFPASALAGKLSDTASTVDGSDDDGGSFCLFCSDDDDDDDSSEEEVPTTRYETDRSFFDYPYAHGAPGYYIVRNRVYDPVVDEKTGTYTEELRTDETLPEGMDVSEGKSSSIVVNAGYGYDWDEVHLADLRLDLDSSMGLGARMRWTGFYEPLEGENDLDTLHLFDLMFKGIVATAPKAALRLGAGGLLMFYESSVNAGLYGAAQLQLFPVRPVIVTAEVQAGYLDEAAYLKGEVALGLAIGPVEVYGGYEGQGFISKNSSVLYHGPRGGIRLWF